MRKILVVMLVAGMATLVACGASSSGDGSSGSDSGEAPVVSDVSDLPNATGPMADAASASLGKAASVGKAAAIGLRFGADSEETLRALSGEGGSLGACETFNAVKSMISSAAMGDEILCHIGQMSEHLPMDTVGDGVDRIVKFGRPGQERDIRGPDKMKLNITMENGSISELEMTMCGAASEGFPNGKPQEYVTMSLVGRAITMSATGYFKEYFDGELFEGWHKVDVTGTRDSNGKYLEKTIYQLDTGVGVNEDGVNTHSQWAVLIHTPGEIKLDGFRSGDQMDRGEVMTYRDQFAARAAILNDTTATFLDDALGDGGIRTKIDAGDYDVNGREQFDDFWNADTGQSVSGAELPVGNGYLGMFDSVSLMDFEDVSIGFHTDIWNCSDDAEIIEPFSGSSAVAKAEEHDQMDSACADYTLGHEWINCYQNVEFSPPQDDGEGGGGETSAPTECTAEAVCTVAGDAAVCAACFANSDTNAGIYACLLPNCPSAEGGEENAALNALCIRNIAICDQ